MWMTGARSSAFKKRGPQARHLRERPGTFRYFQKATAPSQLINADRTYTIVPVQIGIVGHSPVMQVWDASVGGCLGTAEVRVLINSDGGAAENLDRADLVIQWNLGNIRSALAAEIFTGEVHILKEANATARPVGLTSRTRIPPARS